MNLLDRGYFSYNYQIRSEAQLTFQYFTWWTTFNNNEEVRRVKINICFIYKN
jgi:hypothetical protein